MAQNVKNLIVWQKAMELTVCIYELTQGFPKDEAFGLITQMRRANVSVAGNIAKGRGRLDRAEFRQFLGLAQGSIFELKTQRVVAKRLGLGQPKTLGQAEALSEEVSKMLSSFIEKLRPATQKLKADS